MSTIKVTNLSGRGGASPNLPDGAVVTGVVTATSFSGSGANLTGVANTDFVVGTAITMAVGDIANVNLTKSAGGVGATVGSYTGVTTYYGDGGSLTGVGESIAPWFFNPDVSDPLANVDTGIGITFNKKILAGSGTATLKIVNAGTAGTTIQSWGIGSATISNIKDLALGSLVSNLIINQTYQIDIPEGFIVDSTGTSYAGTAYTFTTQGADNLLFAWGYNDYGILGQNNVTEYSSPVQIPGTNWGQFDQDGSGAGVHILNVKTDGTLWGWGYDSWGMLGQNSVNNGYSSPVQIGSDTAWNTANNPYYDSYAIKTDGTLWVMGYNGQGQLGINLSGNPGSVSSPTQVPGTTWSKISGSAQTVAAIKTDGTLWMWGDGDKGALGMNNGQVSYSSPVQVPGTNWRSVTVSSSSHTAATKTDGTLWVWGNNPNGELGQGNTTRVSSPVQIPGTNWSSAVEAGKNTTFATKTNGQLWGVGNNQTGELGINETNNYSSPKQVPGTTWGTTQRTLKSGDGSTIAIKTDGTLWGWGNNEHGSLPLLPGHDTHRSSPIQIPGTWTSIAKIDQSCFAIQQDTTP